MAVDPTQLAQPVTEPAQPATPVVETIRIIPASPSATINLAGLNDLVVASAGATAQAEVAPVKAALDAHTAESAANHAEVAARIAAVEDAISAKDVAAAGSFVQGLGPLIPHGQVIASEVAAYIQAHKAEIAAEVNALAGSADRQHWIKVAGTIGVCIIALVVIGFDLAGNHTAANLVNPAFVLAGGWFALIARLGSA